MKIRLPRIPAWSNYSTGAIVADIRAMRRERDGLPPIRVPEAPKLPAPVASPHPRPSRKERERERWRRAELLRSEVEGMDATMGAVFSDRAELKYEPWTGSPSPRPVGSVVLSTSYKPSRQKCAGEAYIYGIADPRDHEIRYVGKTQNALEQRLWEHEFQPSNSRVCSMLKGMRRAGLKPEIVVLEICLKHRWHRREEFWIAALSSGGRLLNRSIGGRFDDPKRRHGKGWDRAKKRHDRAMENSPVKFIDPSTL
jgi:hypothetical protein